MLHKYHNRTTTLYMSVDIGGLRMNEQRQKLENLASCTNSAVRAVSLTTV